MIAYIYCTCCCCCCGDSVRYRNGPASTERRRHTAATAATAVDVRRCRCGELERGTYRWRSALISKRCVPPSHNPHNLRQQQRTTSASATSILTIHYNVPVRTSRKYTSLFRCKYSLCSKCSSMQLRAQSSVVAFIVFRCTKSRVRCIR